MHCNRSIKLLYEAIEVGPKKSNNVEKDVAVVSKYFTLRKLTSNFYSFECTELARSLLGKILCRRLENGEILKGKIVETEAYLGKSRIYVKFEE